MSKARTLNPYDMEERIHNLEENGGGGGGTTDAAKRADIATEFSAETSYTAGNYVYYEGTLYIFNVDHAAGEWDATDVAEANVTDEVTSNKAAIDALEGSVPSILTQHLTDLTTDANGCIFLDLAVDSYILLGASTKDFSATYGPLFTIGTWQDSGTYKYLLRLTDYTGTVIASSDYWVDICYTARPTA